MQRMQRLRCCTCTLLLTTALHGTAALSAAPRRHVTRRTFAASCVLAAAQPATAAATRATAVELVQARAPTSQIDAAVDALPAQPAVGDSFARLAKGRWRVVHAPHIKNILAAVRFPFRCFTTSEWTATAVAPWNRT